MEPTSNLPAKRPGRMLTAQEFRVLAEVPAAVVWLANLRNLNTRRAYQRDVQAFTSFVGIKTPEEFRIVTRAHVIAWRDELEGSRPRPSAGSSRRSQVCSTT